MGLSPFTSASADHGVVGGILDEGGHNESFVGPISFIGAIKGISDIDAIMERVVGVIGDESRRRARGLVL